MPEVVDSNDTEDGDESGGMTILVAQLAKDLRNEQVSPLFHKTVPLGDVKAFKMVQQEYAIDTSVPLTSTTKGLSAGYTRERFGSEVPDIYLEVVRDGKGIVVERQLIKLGEKINKAYREEVAK